jgi:hypothetical protein
MKIELLLVPDTESAKRSRHLNSLIINVTGCEPVDRNFLITMSTQALGFTQWGPEVFSPG